MQAQQCVQPTGPNRSKALPIPSPKAAPRPGARPPRPCASTGPKAAPHALCFTTLVQAPAKWRLLDLPSSWACRPSGRQGLDPPPAPDHRQKAAGRAPGGAPKAKACSRRRNRMHAASSLAVVGGGRRVEAWLLRPSRAWPWPGLSKKDGSRLRLPELLAWPGGHSAGGPPDPIPNSAVKPRRAQGTAVLTVGERVVARPSQQLLTPLPCAPRLASRRTPGTSPPCHQPPRGGAAR